MQVNETLHIAQSGSAAGSIRILTKDRPGQSVLNIAELFSIGPLYQLDAKSGIEARQHYFKQVFERILIPELYEELLSPHIGLPVLDTIDFDKQRIVLWCGPNADEQIMLRAVCARLLDWPVSVINVDSIGQRSVGACTLKDLHDAEQFAFTLTHTDHQAFAADWQRLTQTTDRLRLIEDGQIIGCKESYFDEALLQACKSHFIKAGRIIGQVMGESIHLIGDTFLDYRLRELIAQGLVEADGTEKALYHMQVRRPSTT